MAFVAKEDSYAERRMLFKNIWETAMQIQGKEGEPLKPKVIKTLRMDDVDKISIGKRKKERIKSLRSVCKKILDFCDEQDADDDHKLYERKMLNKIEDLKKPLILKRKKIKTHRRRRKVKKSASWNSSPMSFMRLKRTAIEKKSLLDECDSSILSLPVKKITVVSRAIVTKPVRPKFPPTTAYVNKGNSNAVTRRKSVKKRLKKAKTSSPIGPAFAVPGTPQFVRAGINPTLYGRAVLRNVKELLKVCKNSIIVKKKTTEKENISDSDF